MKTTPKFSLFLLVILVNLIAACGSSFTTSKLAAKTDDVEVYNRGRHADALDFLLVRAIWYNGLSKPDREWTEIFDTEDFFDTEDTNIRTVLDTIANLKNKTEYTSKNTDYSVTEFRSEDLVLKWKDSNGHRHSLNFKAQDVRYFSKYKGELTLEGKETQFILKKLQIERPWNSDLSLSMAETEFEMHRPELGKKKIWVFQLVDEKSGKYSYNYDPRF